MYEELRDDQLIDKVGGRFKLSTLYPKAIGGPHERRPTACGFEHQGPHEDRVAGDY